MPIRIGITGHQDRDGIDWSWVRSVISTKIREASDGVIGLSSLASGSDQVFAKCVLDCNGRLIAVIPIKHYEDTFESASDRKDYQKMLTVSEVVHLTPAKDDEESFLNAGKWIVDHSEEMVAVWDGEPAEGLGGTADIVRYAQRIGRPVLHINPLTAAVSLIPS